MTILDELERLHKNSSLEDADWLWFIERCQKHLPALIEVARAAEAYFKAPFCPATGDDSAMAEAEQKMLVALEKLK